MSEEVFARILRDELVLPDDDPDFQKTLALYRDMLESFNDATTELNAWIYLQIKKAKETEEGSELNLGEISPDRLFNIRLGVVESNYTIDDLGARSANVIPVSQDELTDQMLHFQEQARTQVFRGKYLIFFLRKLLLCLVEDRNRRKK